jgi:signal transduction histidine kinase/HPt (histidine-containing phosphotransfer) domain-containing protein/ActR/RegA family two-component response regulator
VGPKSTVKFPRAEPRITAVQATLDELFPFHIVFNRELVIVQIGRSLSHISPDIVTGVRLTQVSKGAEGFDTKSVRRDKPVRLSLQVPRTKLTLRGMVVVTEHEGVLAFLASVWPSRSQEIDALPLEPADFAPFDSTFDYVQELSALDALQGKRKSAEVLAEQRAELKRANRRLETLYAVSQILDRATSLEAAALGVLKALCEALRTQSICFWIVDARGVEPMGLFESNQSTRRTDKEIDSTLAELALKTGNRQQIPGRIAVPVRGTNNLVGVFDIDGAELDEEGAELTEDIARSLGLFVEKQRAAAEILRARDEAQEATKLKSSFLANMSHEVRTPLNAIIGMMDLVLAGELGAPEREYVLLSQSAGRDLLRIVNDILDFSKVEAGQLETESVPFDLSDLVHKLVLQHGTLARDKKLRLLASYDPAAPRWVRGDPVRVGQVLGNLLGNAIKFTDKGEVSLRVKGGIAGLMRFDVSDTGIGIPESAHATLFEPFRQADSSTTRRYGGTGLGLAIARALCTQMNGQLGFTSTVDKGTRFWVDIPLPPAPAPKRTKSGELRAVEEKTPKRTKRTVLVAEDNPVNQRLLKGFLDHLGYDVHMVETGELVVEAAKSAKYAAILMDWQMPVMDGLEVARRIRLAEKGRRGVPIIALTAHALRGDRERCLAAGMNDYLTKPVRLEELGVTLDRWTQASTQTMPDGTLPPVPTEHPGLDLVGLRAMGGSGELNEDASLIAEVVGVYLEDAPHRFERLRAALSAGDRREASRQSHTIKGASSNVCAVTLVKIMGQMEELCRAGHLDEARTLLLEATREFDRVVPALRQAVRL